MADGIYVGMCGAAARTAELDAVADNLANAQTPGFKASRPAFESFLPASGAPDKAYPASVATAFDLRPGPTTRTGNPLDVTPEGSAFLAVEMESGGRGYTRNGQLSLDGEGRLVQNGRPVLDSSGAPINIPPGSSPTIDGSGVIHAGGVAVGQLGLFELQGRVDRVEGGLLAPASGGSAESVEGKVRPGEVELGNATPIDGMVQLISAQRHFDASMQALQTYRSIDQRSAEVGRVR